MIKFLVKGQDIETLEHEVIAADQVSFVNIKFTFDNNWKPLHKVVKFTQECDEYFRVLGVDGTSCYLPSELHPGAVKMSLFGYDPNATETIRATTVIHTLHVRPSGFEGEGSTPVPPTPDLYQQLLQQIGEAHKGADGKSAFEIAVKHGYIGTEEQWLETLKGTDGVAGADGRDGTDGQPGADGLDGKSAYEIAVEHGYIGTEEEWLAEIKPDMSDYPRREELLLIIERKIEPTQEKAHVHNNLTVLNGITAAKIAKWDSATEWQLQFQTLQGNVMDYQMQMNHRMDDADETISAVDTAVQQLRDSNQYEHQNMSDEISLLTNRVTNLEIDLEGIDTLLGRIVG